MPQRDEVQTFGPGQRIWNPFIDNVPGSFNGMRSHMNQARASGSFGAMPSNVVAMPNIDGPLEPGFRSQVVATLQQILNAHGARLVVDGTIAPDTQGAVWKAFDDLVNSPSEDAVRLTSAGPGGLSVGQLIATLTQAYTADASVRPRAVGNVPTDPSEPDGQVSMTPADAVDLEKSLGLRGSGVPTWAFVAGGAALIGLGVWLLRK